MNFSAFLFPIICFVFNYNRVECRNKADALRGIYVSAFTPIGENGRVNITNIPAYAKYLKDTRVDGVVLSALGGEGPNLSVAEKKTLYEAWRMFAKSHDLQIITQIGGTSLPDILELAKYVEALHVDGILVLPSTYYQPTTAEQLTGFLQLISDAAPTLPIIFYQRPEIITDVDIPEFFRIASSRIPQFKGLCTDLKTAIEVQITNELRSDQTIYIFDNTLTSAAIVYGFDSFMEYETNICPDLFLEIVTQTIKGNVNKASYAQRQLTNLIYDLTTGFDDDISVMKVATELVTGIKLGNTRLPVPALTEEDREEIAYILKEYDIPLARKN